MGLLFVPGITTGHFEDLPEGDLAESGSERPQHREQEVKCPEVSTFLCWRKAKETRVMAGMGGQRVSEAEGRNGYDILVT